jgi:DNA-binding MarR family transcriptional regulator
MPAITGQAIGQAQIATRAVLDELLARHATTFHQWVMLNVAGVAGGTVTQDQLVKRLTTGLRLSESVVLTTRKELLDLGLASATVDHLELTDRGRERFDQIRAGIAAITDRLYGNIPAADLEVAGRVLAIVTERANAR